MFTTKKFIQSLSITVKNELQLHPMRLEPGK